MGKWKILHLVGNDISIWKLGQIENHIEYLPDELFSQNIIADNPKTAHFIERQLIRKISCLGKRLANGLISAHNLHKIIKSEEPDILVCWDIQTAEQLRLALLGIRVPCKVVLMLFRPFGNTEEQTKFQLAYHSLQAHVLCNTETTRNYISSGIANVRDRIYNVCPTIRSVVTADKQALRKYFNFNENEILIYVSPDARPDDILKALNAIGIVQPVYHNIRAVIPVKNNEFATRLIKFNRDTLIDDILYIRNYSESYLLLSCCDVVIIPRGMFSEHIETLQAMQLQIPVVISEYDISNDILICNETFLNAKKVIPRIMASAIYNLVSNENLRNDLTRKAYEIVNEYCSKLTYRSTMIKIYQQILQ